MYFLDLLGTFAFAITGAFKAKSKGLNIFGVIFLGIITAVGGGTFRDLIINRVPLFYIKDPNYLSIAIVGGVITYFVPAFFKKRYTFFRLIDSVGLAAFAIIGTSIVYSHLFFTDGNPTAVSLLASTFLGMVTGFGGGVIRDAVMGDQPLSLKHGSNYALSAFLGAFSFYLLMFIDLRLSVLVSLVVTITLREVVSEYGIYVKVIKNQEIKS